MEGEEELERVSFGEMEETHFYVGGAKETRFILVEP